MPIYAYRCSACGHAKDVLQKLSDAPLTTCPACGAESFSKQVTAAGFQLKGSGWYVTDFRDGNKKSATDKKPDGEGGAGADGKTDGGSNGDATKADAKAADAAPATAGGGKPDSAAGASSKATPAASGKPDAKTPSETSKPASSGS